jgi:hypothetical protein
MSTNQNDFNIPAIKLLRRCPKVNRILTYFLHWFLEWTPRSVKGKSIAANRGLLLRAWRGCLVENIEQLAPQREKVALGHLGLLLIVD